jgi:N-formylglutamate deformylase
MIEVVQGAGPLVLGLPHTGAYMSSEIMARLNGTGQALADADWHVERLYDGLVGDVTTVRTPVHRYVIDVNRAPGGESLYPGQNTTGLIPLTDFEGAPIWRDGEAPDAAEVEARRETYHAPYHAALAAEMERVRARHGFAILYDCHSIRSRIPYLFDGVLPDLNIGTNGGATCAPGIAAAVQDACAASGYTSVTDGRFKGGWTTRHYGRPDEGLHAIQMELAQSTYLTAETPPWRYDTARAETLRATLRPILETLSAWRP